jgi:hypothetical protein
MVMTAEEMYGVYRASLMRVGVVLPPWHLIGEDEREAWHDVDSALSRSWVSNAGPVEIA